MAFFGQNDSTATQSDEITVITEGLTICGDITTSDNVYINGTVKGRIVSKCEIAVGPKGRIEGEVVSNRLRVSGYVDGVIDCDTIHILPTGHVVGRLTSAKLEIHPGGYLHAEHNVRKNAAKTPPVAVVPVPVKKTEPVNVTPMPKRAEVEKPPENIPPPSSDGSSRWSLGIKRAAPAPAPVRPDAGELEAENTAPTETRRWHSTWPRR
jgi:cytoskeletal protein CcmA (bactofilin family)